MGKLETLKRLHASMRDKLDELTEDVDDSVFVERYERFKEKIRAE